jgi:hypothetical protein
MRVCASLITLAAAALLGTPAQAQTADKAAAATAPKAQATTKASTTSNRSAAAPAQKVTGEAGKAKIEGVSTNRSKPVEGHKDGGCHSMASDA